MMQGMPMMQAVPMQNINVQQAQFQTFSPDIVAVNQKENINLIMDVPLEVTVELGRTSKSIQDILEFAPGTIIELNKIAGEPIDVLVNGKYVAKGEVVVIEESFGVRVTEIHENDDKGYFNQEWLQYRRRSRKWKNGGREICRNKAGFSNDGYYNAGNGWYSGVEENQGSRSWCNRNYVFCDGSAGNGY